MPRKIIGIIGDGLFKRVVSAAQWYVAPASAQGGIGSDTNSGTTSAAPFATFHKASTVATAGQTISFASGNYPALSGNTYLTAAGGSSGNPITYKSAVPFGAKIIGGGALTTSANPNLAGLEIRGAWQVFDGFEIDGSGSNATTWMYGCYQGGSNNIVQNCKIHHVMTDTTAFANLGPGGGAGIMIDEYYGGANSDLLNCLVHDIGILGQGNTTVHCIYYTQPGRCFNNIAYAGASDGITSWHAAKNIHIINNTVYNCGSSGILVGANVAGSGGGFVVYNNIIHTVPNGLREESGTDATNLYSNNEIYNCTTPLRLLNGLTDPNQLTTDPLFVSTSTPDFHLQTGSPGKASGIGTLGGYSSPAADYSGTTRSTSTPSRGAYE